MKFRKLFYILIYSFLFKNTYQKLEEEIKTINNIQFSQNESFKLRINYNNGEYYVPKSIKDTININIDGAYKFKPKKYDVNKVMLVEPSFVNKIAKKNLQKKLDTLLKQVDIVLNDETDDEGGNYVFGEIDRMQGLVITLYAQYLEPEYLSLVMMKLEK